MKDNHVDRGSLDEVKLGDGDCRIGGSAVVFGDNAAVWEYVRRAREGGVVRSHDISGFQHIFDLDEIEPGDEEPHEAGSEYSSVIFASPYSPEKKVF